MNNRGSKIMATRIEEKNIPMTFLFQRSSLYADSYTNRRNSVFQNDDKNTCHPVAGDGPGQRGLTTGRKSWNISYQSRSKILSINGREEGKKKEEEEDDDDDDDEEQNDCKFGH